MESAKDNHVMITALIADNLKAAILVTDGFATVLLYFAFAILKIKRIIP